MFGDMTAMRTALTNPSPPILRLSLLLWGAGFAVATTWSPLYFSNQHQYFLHGLAAAGHGHLAQDWLVGTLDPAPLFSFLVEWSARLLGESSFIAGHIALMMIYFISLVVIVDSLPHRIVGRRRFAFLALLIVLHAGGLRWLSVQAFGKDYPWNFQAGVAGQYLLGPGLQPSVFGVFLLAGMAAAVHGYWFRGIGLACAAAILHGTYLLPAAFLTLTGMFEYLRHGDRRQAILLGIFAFLTVLPMVIHHLIIFAPTTAEDFAEAQRILVEQRIPHHCMIVRWLDLIAWMQVAWIGSAILQVRGTPLFPLLAWPAILGLLGTIAQALLDSPGLALAFPWRISVFLVPIATAVHLATFSRRMPERSTAILAGILLLASIVGGAVLMSERIGYRQHDAELPVLEFVRTHAGPNDVYLIPVNIPKPDPSKRGSVSTSFTPPPRSTTDKGLIAVDLQRFRLATGARLFVDFKSIPYKDVEIREWFRRVQAVERWYASSIWDTARIVEVRANGITHLIAPADRPLQGSGLNVIYSDSVYIVYRIEGA